jgi:hypothetical protein
MTIRLFWRDAFTEIGGISEERYRFTDNAHHDIRLIENRFGSVLSLGMESKDMVREKYTSKEQIISKARRGISFGGRTVEFQMPFDLESHNFTKNLIIGANAKPQVWTQSVL